MTRFKISKWHPLALWLVVLGLITLVFTGVQECRRAGRHTVKTRTVKRGRRADFELVEI
jgi:hypothetical protein